jgi:hypothetical protein
LYVVAIAPLGLRGEARRRERCRMEGIMNVMYVMILLAVVSILVLMHACMYACMVVHILSAYTVSIVFMCALKVNISAHTTHARQFNACNAHKNKQTNKEADSRNIVQEWLSERDHSWSSKE